MNILKPRDKVLLSRILLHPHQRIRVFRFRIILKTPNHLQQTLKLAQQSTAKMREMVVRQNIIKRFQKKSLQKLKKKDFDNALVELHKPLIISKKYDNVLLSTNRLFPEVKLSPNSLNFVIRQNYIWQMSDSTIQENKSTKSNQYVRTLMQFVMWEGKKTVAQTLVYNTLNYIANADKTDFSQNQCTLSFSDYSISMRVLYDAVTHIRPAFELRKQRRGRTFQLIPGPCPRILSENRAIRWLVQAARDKQQKKGNFSREKHYSFAYYLAQELSEAAKGMGFLKQRRNEIHRLAERNRRLAKRRWW